MFRVPGKHGSRNPEYSQEGCAGAEMQRFVVVVAVAGEGWGEMLTHRGWGALGWGWFLVSHYTAVTPSHGTTQVSSGTSQCALGRGVQAEDRGAGTSAGWMTWDRIARNCDLCLSLSLSPFLPMGRSVITPSSFGDACCHLHV